MDLAAIEEIKRIKYRYLRCLDLKRWEALADTLCVNATAQYGTLAYGEPLSFTGRDEIVRFLRDKLGNDVITVHSVSQPEIDVDGDTASGTWCLEDTVIAADYRVMIKGAAFYEDLYRRCDGGVWRIERTGYQRTYEAMMSFDDLPSFQLTANRWAVEAPAGGE